MISKVGLYRNLRNKKLWVVRWYGEYEPATGKRKRYSKSFKLKGDAEAFRLQKEVEFDQGHRRDKPKEITLEEFCKIYTECLTVRPETVKLYDNTQRRLLQYFGSGASLNQITPLNAERFMASLKPLNGKGELSTSAVHRVLRNCRTMFNKAVIWEILNRNAFAKVTAVKVVTRDWHYLTPQQYKLLLKAAPSLRWRAFYALCYTAALRLGEALSILWTDIDYEKRQVKVQRRPGTVTLPPFEIKDKDSRTVDLPRQSIEALEDLYSYYDGTQTYSPYIVLDREQYERVKAKWTMYQKQRKPWKNKNLLNNVLTNFKRHLKKAGIEPEEGKTLSVQTLRKSCIQNWANNITNPEVVKVLAGHSDLKTTMQYYCRIDSDQRAKAAAAIENLLREADAGIIDF
ncbi:MAG: site-specific integrase [Planctomycetes bacterium]|nr:site-specific integrase [Planctomycetota bacterium]MBL7146177.1 site-specific integrase [Phycisphaerae bacterium]